MLGKTIGLDEITQEESVDRDKTEGREQPPLESG